MNIRDERSIGEQVRSGFCLAGWVLLTVAVVGVMLRSDMALVDRSAPTVNRVVGGCGLVLVAVGMFIGVERWGKWFVGALGYWILKSVFTLAFRPSKLPLEYLLLFILAFVLCARCALSHAPPPAIEKLGMVLVVIALSFSLILDSPTPLLVGVAVLAATQVAYYVFGASEHHTKLRQAR